MAFPSDGYNGGAGRAVPEIAALRPSSRLAGVCPLMFVHAGAATTPARGGSAQMAVCSPPPPSPRDQGANVSANPTLVTATVPRLLAILGLHESRDGCPSRALPDLCGTPHGPRLGSSAERDILGNDTAPPLAACRVCVRVRVLCCASPAINQIVVSSAFIPGMSMAMKLPAGQNSLWVHVLRQEPASIPPRASEGFPSATCSVSPRVSSASEPRRSGKTCTSPFSPLRLRTGAVASLTGTGTGIVGFEKAHAQAGLDGRAGQVGTSRSLDLRRCMGRPGRPCITPGDIGLNPAGRDDVPNQ